jgi:hypothetical protein
MQGVVSAFFGGFGLALDTSDVGELQGRLEQLPSGWRGFGWEGAAMALRILDSLSWRSTDRIRRLLDGVGTRHEYLIHVGLGWAHARLPGRIVRGLRDVDPLLRSLAFDGYGFHEGLFATRRTHERRVQPRLDDGASHAFDQGLGRSLWFVSAFDSRVAAARLSAFPAARRPDLWSGLGLAVAYAGGASEEDLELLHVSAGDLRPHLMQGIAFAVAARVRGRDPSPDTELVCRLLLGRDPEAVAAAVEGLRPRGPRAVAASAYEGWRRAVRESVCKDEVVHG